ncbi:MAG: response regulator [Sulfurimonas sp.]|nr:response regulator [Sulfurimonas sp.]
MPLVIFVDDSETALASTRMVTSSMPIEVKQYTEAQVALAEIEAGMTPDLIITDLNMPVMNGLEFLEGLRKVSSTSRTPCLMLTTETKAELKQKGKALGLTGWIVKPFNPAQLKQAITRVLRLP